MHIEGSLALAGLIIGVLVGLTGMGGGALLTPVLVLFFGAAPGSAVSSDLVTSLVMRPIGAAVHLRRGTVHRGIVFWLLLGAVPAAFGGVFVLRAFGSGNTAQDRIELALGAALLLAVVGMLARMPMRRRAGEGLTPEQAARRDAEIPVRPIPTLAVGLVGGLVVGMTSVGSGSVIMVALMWLYPQLSLRALVGTDLVQAVPLVGSAAIAHIFFGDVSLTLTLSLLIGAIPGVYAGAQISSRTHAGWLRPTIAVVLLASALKMLSVSSTITGLACAALALALLLAYAVGRRRAAPAYSPAIHLDSAPKQRVSVGAGDTRQRAHISEV